ncbi:anti-sigma factor family protein [Methylohalobius crimeensis]|uniref:anti-sigma factor family protein n=1 Tax=Methylohalobius crimeensis TaxID=244365 RepID=UPI0003B4CDB0|nr:hypothetical protein [Methylohalobius crimeensis]
MLSCKQAVELSSKAQDKPLSWRERMALWFHLRLCQICRRYTRQLRLLRRVSASLRPEDCLSDTALSAEARRRIEERLHREQRRAE